MRLTLQVACAATSIPTRAQIKTWAKTALTTIQHPTGDLTVRVVDEQEMTTLNHQYRGKPHPTDVLSFPFTAPELPPNILGRNILGDIVICAPILETQATQKSIPPPAHWAHLIIHATLHLCGHDHQHPKQAQEMESLERQILKKCGFTL